MTQFVRVERPTLHAGWERLQFVAHSLARLARWTVSGQGMVALLAFALVATVAQQMANASSEGALLGGVVVLWALLLLALAVSAAAGQRMLRRAAEAWAAWRLERRAASSDAIVWREAKADPRVMHELRAAMDRLV